jgi:integrase
MQPKLVSMDEVELIRFLKAAKARSQRDYTAFLVGFHHGLRVSEIANLTLADADLKDGRITIRRLKGSMTSEQSLQFVKGSPILDERRALRDWLEQRNDRSNYLFPSQKGGRMDRSAIFRAYQAAAEDAGLPVEKRHPHCLKHSRARLLVESGVNLMMAKEWLGHRAIASTAIYATPSPAAVERAVAQANAETF